MLASSNTRKVTSLPQIATASSEVFGALNFQQDPKVAILVCIYFQHGRRCCRLVTRWLQALPKFQQILYFGRDDTFWIAKITCTPKVSEIRVFFFPFLLSCRLMVNCTPSKYMDELYFRYFRLKFTWKKTLAFHKEMPHMLFCHCQTM